MNDDMKVNGYFTTGEFARLCHVTKHTLFHYDQIGIFSPEFTDKNGYRYYSSYQYDVFFVISSLREIGMPLKEIKQYMDKRSVEEMKNLLEREVRLIDDKIKSLKRLKGMIEERREIMGNIDEIDTSNIYIEYLPEIIYVETTIENSSERGFTEAIEKLVAVCDKNKIETSFIVGTILSYENVVSDNFMKYDSLYFRVSKLNKVNLQSLLNKREAGRYLCAYHTGGYDTTDKTYSRILSYAEKNGIALTAGDRFYEEGVVDELAVKGYENHVIKIVVRAAV